MNYTSTRSNTNVSPSYAVLKGLAPDGGLYVPEEIPKIFEKLNHLADLSYQDLAFEVLSVFLTDFSDEELRQCISSAYGNGFEQGKIAPVVKVENSYFLELFHGRTSAFKDMALSILPYLTMMAAKKNNMSEKPVILTATSGDTGKAALAGFAGVEGCYIIVFFPENGVSYIQKKQMQTQDGDNTAVIGIEGNFDQAQAGVKAIFNDKALGEHLKKAGYALTSANSINVGRLLPQIVYYFYAYGQLVKSGEISMGEKLDFTVPTGNFGNILAGYYAKKMGLPIGKLICASNDNKILYDFFSTGVYDKNREFHETSSPSMDILVSSNLERFLYNLCQDTNTISELMSGLSHDGRFKFNLTEHDIEGMFATEQEAYAAIKKVYEQGYVMDTHTAVAYAALEKYRHCREHAVKNVIVATASPYKFAEQVCEAIESVAPGEPFSAIERLHELSGQKVPPNIGGLKEKPDLHGRVCDTDKMADEVLAFLNDRALNIGL